MSETKIPTEPLLVDAKTAVWMIGVGKTKLYALHASGRLPEPIRLGRAVRWSVQELREWTAAGCPARDRWQAMNGASAGQATNGR